MSLHYEGNSRMIQRKDERLGRREASGVTNAGLTHETNRLAGHDGSGDLAKLVGVRPHNLDRPRKADVDEVCVQELGGFDKGSGKRLEASWAQQSLAPQLNVGKGLCDKLKIFQLGTPPHTLTTPLATSLLAPLSQATITANILSLAAPQPQPMPMPLPPPSSQPTLDSPLLPPLMSEVATAAAAVDPSSAVDPSAAVAPPAAAADDDDTVEGGELEWILAARKQKLAAEARRREEVKRATALVMDTGLRIDSRIARIAGVQGPAVDAAAAAAAAVAAEPPAEPPPAEPSADEPSADEPSADEPSAAEPSADEPSADEPSAAVPSAAEPSAAEPSAAEPSAAEPSAAPSSAAPLSAAPSSLPHLPLSNAPRSVGKTPAEAAESLPPSPAHQRQHASNVGKRPASLALGQLSESEPKKQKQKSLASRQNLWFCNCREEWPRPKGTQGNPHHQDECRREQATKRVIKEQPIAGETVLHMLPRAKKAGRRSRRFSGPGQDDWEETSEEEQSL